MADNIISGIGSFIQKKQRKTQKQTEWYRLDNAASIFSLMNSERSTNVFRVSCTLKDRIDLKYMQLALDRIIERFPYFNVTLENGLFWSYWEQNKKFPKIEIETRNPCQKITLYKKNTLPFRVKAYFNRIAIEFHHSITDGTGAMTFLRALVADYLSLKGVKPSDWGDLFRSNQTPNPNESDYSYRESFQRNAPNPKINGKGFKPPLTVVDKGVFHIISGTVSVKEILYVTRERKVSITDLLTSIYLEALQEIAYKIPEEKRKKYFKPIRIAVPVNLRNHFPSKTMRNFSFMFTPEIDPRLGKHNFEEILKIVHHSLRRENSKKNLSQYISRNVRGELYPFVRTVPLHMKRLFAQLLYKKMGEAQNSGKLSNVGKVTMPKEFAEKIENFEFILAPSETVNNGCAVVSFNDKLIINFSRTVEEPEVEKFFFRKLVKLGIHVKIESN